MKIYTKTWIFAFMAIFAFTLASCDDDEEIARTLEGTWQGDMYVTTYWNDRYYDATSTEVCFLRDPYRYSSGTGYWVDYYNDRYWGGYNYVANHIEWEVNYGTIRIYFVEDDYVDIYNYSLDYDYFTGYIDTYNGDRQKFNLRHVSSPNWSRYDRWGYSYYDDYYYYGNGTSMSRAKASGNAVEKPKRIFRVKE